MKGTWKFGIIVLIIGFRSPHGVTDALNAAPISIHPYLGNCMPDIKSAKEQYFLIKTGFLLTPLWNESLTGDVSWITNSYNLTYTLFRWLETDDPQKVQPKPYPLTNWKIGRHKIRVHPFKIEAGIFKLITHARRVTKPSSGELYNPGPIPDTVCYFVVQTLPPLIVLEGGVIRVVPANADVLVSAEQSLDRNRPMDGKNLDDLNFYWKCSQNIGQFCRMDLISTKRSFVIPASKVINKDVIDVRVWVVPSYPSLIDTLRRQQIKVVAGAAMLTISCVRNCPPVTEAPNYQLKTSFRVSCKWNCGGIIEQDYEWEVTTEKKDESYSFDYDKGTEQGRRGVQFIISPGVLKPSTTYLVTVKLATSVGREGESTMLVQYASMPRIKDCKIEPNSGVSLKTQFKFSCTEEPPPDKSNFYEFFADKNKEEKIISGFYPEVFKIHFYLPPSKGREFVVKISKFGGPANYIRLSPQVTAAYEGKTDEEALGYYKRFANGSEAVGSIMNQISSDDPDVKRLGIQMFQALVNELIAGEVQSNKTYEFAKNLTYAVAENLLKNPTKSTEELVTMSDSLTKLINHNELAKSDPFLAQIATTVCRMMIIRHVEDLQKNEFPLNSETQFNQVGSVLTKCLEANVEANFDLIQAVLYNISVLEVSPASNQLDISENYPDYTDVKDDYGTHLSNLQKVTDNVLNSTAVSAKSLALTNIAMGEHFARRLGKYSATLVAKGTGQDLSKTKIQLLDVIIVPSNDFNDVTHPFDILMSIWSRDLMWWNHKKTRIATKIVSVQFWHSTCKKRIRHFKAPAAILMNLANSSNFSNVATITANVSVPNYDESSPDEDLNRYIRVHRIGIPKHSVLHVVFSSSYEFYKFDVVLTKFYFPTIDDFVFNKTFGSGAANEIRIINYDYFDVWVYFGVLPSKKSKEIRLPLLFYDVNFTLTYCIRWNQAKAFWQPDCIPGIQNTMKIITCECHHFSVIAGYIQNAESTIQELWQTEIILELQSVYVIFITISITFALYCALLFVRLFARQGQLYFLADNIREHLYAYLLIVRTENQSHAGTTSRVVIQLRGSKASSEPHVLNYPDPKLFLLQRHGEDSFILTTERHLGDIQQIELWYDCWGPSPSWHCRDIIVYDMQKNVQWYFKVKTLFAVTKHGCTYLAIEPSEWDVNESAFKQTRVCNHFHTWQLWSGERSFSYVARLTVVFSNILMIYVLVLTTLGVPSLQLKDSLDPYPRYYFPSGILFNAIICSFGAFLVHYLIAWSFRFSDFNFYAFRKEHRRNLNVSPYCWAILSLLITVSLSFLIIYGFWVPWISSFIWLTCCIVAVLVDIIIWENIFIIVQTLMCRFKRVVNLDEKFESYLKLIETQRLVLYKKFDSTMLRPYFSHLYVPLEAMQITRRRIVVELRRGIYNDLEDLVMYGIYNIILYMVILVNRGNLTIIAKNEMEDIVEGKHTRTLAFSEIGALKQIYEYLNFTLNPSLHTTHWHENLTSTAGGLMIDEANKFIGVPRLRQHRVTSGTCVVPRLMRFLNTTCWSEFSMPDGEFRTFGPKWAKFSPGADEYDRLHSIWSYFSESETETFAVMGRIGTYSGGGYIAYLGRTLVNSYINLIRLVQLFWIDHQLRGLFVEFLAYNANYNIFMAVTLLFEQSATGFTSSFTEVNVIRMLFVENEVEQMAMVIFTLFVLWVIMLMLKLSVGIIRHLGTFYRRIWLMIDLIINVMSIASISMFILRMKMVERYLDSLESVKHNEFVSYFSLLYVESFLTLFAGILICIATARLWKFLRFGLFFRILERTLSMAAFALFGVSLAFAVILTAFGFSGILIYGNEFPELSSFIKIVATLIQLSLKPDQFDLSDYLHLQISYYYFAVYLILMQMVLCVYIGVIIMAYVKAQLEFSVEPDSYTVFDYLHERVGYMPKLFRSKIERIRGGEKAKSPVTAKADEFRFANSVTVTKSRLKSMSFIVSCIVRNMNQSTTEQGELTEYEQQLMLGVCKLFVFKTFKDDELELFFKGHFEGQRIRLIDEKGIDNMAEFVKLMFRGIKKGPAQKSDRNIVQCCKMAKKKIIILKTILLKLKLMAHKIDDAEHICNNLLEDQ